MTTDRLPKLLGGQSLPYRNHPGSDPQAAIRLATHRLSPLLDSGDWLETESGCAAVQVLDWDSDILGLRCGRVSQFAATDRVAELIEAVCQRSDALSIAHLTIRIDGDDAHFLPWLRAAGFEIVDTIHTFAKALGESPGREIDLADPTDAQEMEALGRTIFTLDRFHTDPALSDAAADALHAAWCKNSALGIAADAVIVKRAGERIAGFVTTKVQSDSESTLGALVGTVILVGTAPWARGKGIGKSAVLDSEQWFFDRGCRIVEVGTQSTNHAASGLYQSLGYSLCQRSFTLRRLGPSMSEHPDLP